MTTPSISSAILADAYFLTPRVCEVTGLKKTGLGRLIACPGTVRMLPVYTDVGLHRACCCVAVKYSKQKRALTKV